MQVKTAHPRNTLIKIKSASKPYFLGLQNHTFLQTSCILTGGNAMIGIGVSGNGSVGLTLGITG